MARRGDAAVLISYPSRYFFATYKRDYYGTNTSYEDEGASDTARQLHALQTKNDKTCVTMSKKSKDDCLIIRSEVVLKMPSRR